MKLPSVVAHTFPFVFDLVFAQLVFSGAWKSFVRPFWASIQHRGGAGVFAEVLAVAEGAM
jgi:hypothetical protein